jgi:proline iminopeptidase
MRYEYGTMGSEYNVVEKVNALRGLVDTYAALYPHWQQIDFRKTAARLRVPVYLFEGNHELAGRLDLARQWFTSLKAPRKHFYLFANAGHSTAYEQFQAFARILTKTVLPQTYSTQPSLRKAQR